MASRATEYLYELLEDEGDNTDFWTEVMDIAGSEWIGFGTEPPEWLKESYVEAIGDAFEEEYWQKWPEAFREDIQGKLERMMEQGWSVREMAQSLIEDEGYPRWRATNVARTEMNWASTSGSLKALEQLEEETGMQIGKEWNSIMGTTSRENHMDFDGTEVGSPDALFPFPGQDGTVYDVQGPGDPSLPPEDRCQCHCFILSSFVMDETDGGKKGIEPSEFDAHPSEPI